MLQGIQAVKVTDQYLNRGEYGGHHHAVFITFQVAGPSTLRSARQALTPAITKAEVSRQAISMWKKR